MVSGHDLVTSGVVQLLSPSPQRSLCVKGKLGEAKTSARVVHGKGKEEERGSLLFALFPSSLARLFFKFIFILLEKIVFALVASGYANFLEQKKAVSREKKFNPRPDFFSTPTWPPRFHCFIHRYSRR